MTAPFLVPNGKRSQAGDRLLALLRLRDGAYGVSIRNLIAQRTERDVAVGAVYTTLECKI